MKPLINVEDITEFKGHEHGTFKAQYADVGGKIGAHQLGYNITIIPPGKKSYPFHNHHVSEEMFLILEGTGLLRFGENKYPLKKNDIVACPTGDRSVAHQIINDSNTFNIVCNCYSFKNNNCLNIFQMSSKKFLQFKIPLCY